MARLIDLTGGASLRHEFNVSSIMFARAVISIAFAPGRVAVMNLAEAAKDKEDEDEFNAETKRIHDMVNEQFDREHPECKDFRTNKNLPEYCY
jgi:hypothetical protein